MNTPAAASEWTTIVGLEIHAELLTQSKMFSACPVVDSVTAPPNSAVDAVSLGLPGTLPVINREAIDTFYYKHLTFDGSASDAKRINDVLSLLVQLLGDGKRKKVQGHEAIHLLLLCLLYTSPSPRD